MSLVWMEGFEGYHGTPSTGITIEELQKVWGFALGGSPTIMDGRNTGNKSFRMGSSGQPGFLSTPRVGADDTIHIGFGFYAGVLSDTTILEIFDTDGDTKFQLLLKSDGDLEVDCPGFGHAIAELTTSMPISDDTWHYVELSVVFAGGTGGSWILKVDDVEEMNTGSVDTVASGTQVNWFYVTFRFPSPVTPDDSFRYDDLYINDSNGSLNNGLLGDVRIVPLFPNADTATSDFTPSTGSDNYAVIDEQAPSDADYVESSTDGHEELLDFENLSVGGTIHAINVKTRAQKTAPDDVRLISKCLSDATASDETAVPVSTETQEHYRIMETDPDTASAWGSSGLNAAQFGFEVEKP